jgi:GTP-binding protein Era
MNSKQLEDLMMTQENYRVGFVAIIGRPNVGKSTLLNQMIGQKIAIMSDKAQTTRNKIQAIYTSEKGQIVFIDTPGIHKPINKLGHHMSQITQNALHEVDLILMVVDVASGFGNGDKFIIEQLKQIKTPIFLVLNKIDRIAKEDLFRIISEYQALYSFTEYIPISALQGNNVERLLEQIVLHLPEGEAYYPDDQITEHPERFICAEFIREKILQLTYEEIPHSIAVKIEQMVQKKTDLVHISAVIYVERDSQKGMIIGKKGTLLKEVAQRARQDIEALLGSRVFLELWVKVSKDWRNREHLIKDFGFFEE